MRQSSLRVLIAFFYLLFFPLIVFAQGAIPNVGGYDITIPGLGSFTATTGTLQLAGIVFAFVIIITLVFGAVFLFWSALGRFMRVPRDSALAFGWNGVKRGIPFFVGVTILFVVLSSFFSTLIELLRLISPNIFLITLTAPWYPYVKTLIDFIFYSYALAGVIATALAYAKDGKRSFRAFIVKPMRYLHFLIANVLYTVGLIIGSILLLFPAAWFGSKFFFWPYLILEEGVPFWEAFRRSAVMIRGAKKEIFLFWYLTVAIIFLGIAVLGIGYLIAFPITILASAYVYNAMTKPDAIQPPTAEKNKQP